MLLVLPGAAGAAGGPAVRMRPAGEASLPVGSDRARKQAAFMFHAL